MRALSILSIDGSVVRCRLTGRADGLIKVAAQFGVERMVAEAPDLEELSLAFYRGEEVRHAA